MSTGRKSSDPYSDLAKLMQEVGYNKDLTLSTGVIVDLGPLRVRLDGNGLVTSNLKPLPHLLPQYYDAHFLFEDGDDQIRSERGKIMIDDDLKEGDRVFILYEVVKQQVSGLILGRRE